MAKKRGKREFRRFNIKIHLTNRWLYTLIAIGILAIIGVGVYAAVDTSQGWHSVDQIEGVQKRVTGTCNGEVMTGINDDGTVVCEADDYGGSSQWDDVTGGINYADGNAGIGTTDPRSKLSVGGTGIASYAIYGTSARNGIYGVGDSIGVAGDGGSYGVMGTGGVGVGAYGDTYDFYATGPGVNYGGYSSIRWKENITEIDNALDKVLNLRGVYFNWNEEHGGEHDMGMIAEEVGEYVPEIVIYEEDGIYATGMDYGALTPLLVEAIKELKEENNKMRESLCNLGAKEWC